MKNRKAINKIKTINYRTTIKKREKKRTIKL